MSIPPVLADLLDTFAMVTDPADRANLLVSYADRFREVPPEVATRPFAREHQVPYCESDAHVWAVPEEDGRLRLYFAVENPSGVSAKALAAILDSTLSGEKPEAFAEIPGDLIERLFRQNISMGKGMGLMAMVQAVQALARRARST
ncbi:MAG: SufE family protein [Acidobacteriota bacterium]